MYRLFVFVFLVFPLGTVTVAQTVNHHENADNLFTVGNTYLVYNSGAKLLKKAEVDSRVVTELQILDTFIILERTSLFVGEGSMKGVFLKGKTSDGKKGYISSKNLSLGYLKLKSGSTLVYQTRQHVEDYLLHFKLSTLPGEILDLGAFNASSLMSLTLYNHRGLPHIDHIIEIDNFDSTCNTSKKTQYLSFNESKNELFIFGHLNKYCPDLHIEKLERLIFPDEDEGIKNTIIYESRKIVLIDKEYQVYETIGYMRKYEWAAGSTYHTIRQNNW